MTDDEIEKEIQDLRDWMESEEGQKALEDITENLSVDIDEALKEDLSKKAKEKAFDNAKDVI